MSCISFEGRLNDTSDLEARVEQLEEDVVDLQDEDEDQEFLIQLLSDDITNIEGDVEVIQSDLIDNENAIEGNIH